MEPSLPSRILAILPLVCLIVMASASLQAAPAPQKADRKIEQRPWPRNYTVNGTQFSVYRPELDSWTSNQLQARAVMAVKVGAASGEPGTGSYRYGVVWLKARTDTDTQGRVVNLHDIAVTRASFPSGRDQEAQYQSMLQSVTQGKSLTVSLDQLEAALAIAATRKSQPVQVNNTPPEIIISFAPSVLVHLDGDPVWRPAGVPGVEKAINTRAQLLRYQGRFFLGYAGHWASSGAIGSGWAAA